MRWLLMVILLLPAWAGAEDLIEVSRDEYLLRFYRDGELLLTSRVIIGKDSRPTPAFETEIHHVIFNPYWNLSPRLAKDVLPKYSNLGIERRGYEFVEGWTVDAPVTSKDPMKCVFDETCRMRQRPGPANFLGKVKFSMPNEHDIYIHDTPARQLFRHRRRAFSSGCIRTEHPLELARLILGSSVDELVGDGQRREIHLDRPVKVVVK